MTMTSVAPVDITPLDRIHVARMSHDEGDPNLLEGINYPSKHGKLTVTGGVLRVRVRAGTCSILGWSHMLFLRYF